MRLDTHYNLGDRVYGLDNVTKNVFIECPDCVGGAIATKTGSLTCPRCAGKGAISNGHQGYWTIRRSIMTVGQIRFEIGTASCKEEYMCDETGVGSGQIWRLELLYRTQELAQAECDLRNMDKSTVFACIHCRPEYSEISYHVTNDYRHCAIHGNGRHVVEAAANAFLAAKKPKEDEI
jgi:hypothetical protein